MIKVSIIIATYNTAEYIGECLDSVMNQSLEPIEVIIVDDGSTDNTDEILSRYENDYENIKVIRQQNAGQGVSINRALNYARGKFIAFMDPDDKYPNGNCLEKLYLAAEENHVLMCGGNIVLNDNGMIKNGYTAGDGDEKQTKNAVIHFNDYHYIYGHTRYLYSTKMMLQYRIKHGEYKRYGDQVLTLSALYRAGLFYELDYPVYEYRIYYRENAFPEETWLDVMKAYKDTLNLMLSKEMKNMYKYNAYEEYKKILINTYRWAIKSEIWQSLLAEIDSFLTTCNWDIFDKTVKQEIETIKLETKKLINIISSNNVIIYGAGENTKRLLRNYKTMFFNIEGVAITNEGEDCMIGDIKVRALSYYKDITNAIVLIVTNKKYWKEMEEYALKMGFKNIEHINMEFVSN